jgi:phytoene dehydrogenase-like protein
MLQRAMYDAIIIGAGHNGLVAAGYLARAGLRVLVLENRELVGGACVTEAIWPGYRVSTAAYLCSLLRPQIVHDLELARFGYHVDPKDPAFFSPFPDGRFLFMWQDRKKTMDEIAKFSRRDAEAYPLYEDCLERLARFIEPLLLEAPPNLPPRSAADFLDYLRLAARLWKLGREDAAALIKVFSQSAAVFLDEWFESDALKVTLATDGVIGANGGPMSPGTAYVLLHHCMGGVGGVRGLWGFVRGGMGAISEALAASARSRGAAIRCSSKVVRILVRGGEARGVVLAGGEEIHARLVVSCCDPRRTFLDLLEPGELPEGFLQAIGRYRSQGTSLKINLALDALPDFRVLPGAGPQHRATMHICPGMEYLERAWDDAKYGQPSRGPLIEMTIPTLYDPSLAPPGKHIMGIFLQYAPYRLRSGAWDEIKESYADHVIGRIAEYAPNMRSIVLRRQVLTPLDLERIYGLTGGNIFHGEMSLDQMFFLRPAAGWARYRTPIRNLYLCGSGAHPGGGVMGAPGRNAARMILNSRR